MPKKIKELKQTHGKVEKLAQYSTLDQILGDTGIGKYKTLDEAVYQKQLNEMNKSDLQSHAVEIGLIPVDDRETLETRLLREFRAHAVQYNTSKPRAKNFVPTTEKEKAKFKKAMDIMSAGR